jgi:hypothetical protein
VNEPAPILTVRHVSLDGSEVSASLMRLASNLFTIRDHRGQHEPFTAQDPLTAVRQGVRVAARHETHIDRATEDDLSLDGLLDALQVDGEPLDPEEWEEVGAQELWPLEETARRWSTAHRLLLDGQAVYGIRGEGGGTILVHADDPEAPHHSWTELLALHWNNQDDAAVGMAGYGMDGLFLVRPGLLAIVASTDEEYEVTIERVPVDADLVDLVVPRLSKVGDPSTLTAAAQTPASGDDDESTGLSLTTSIGHEDFNRIIKAVQAQPL